MGSRLQLHEVFLTFTDNVYFQGPAEPAMEFPCIVYKRDPARTNHADDIPYHVRQRYQVTVIDRNPDSLIPGKVAALSSCIHTRNFAKDRLNHDVYTLYF